MQIATQMFRPAQAKDHKSLGQLQLALDFRFRYKSPRLGRHFQQYGYIFHDFSVSQPANHIEGNFQVPQNCSGRFRVEAKPLFHQ
jgi:hypothetical protein